MSRETTVVQSYTCDMCGLVAETPRGLPTGWRELRVERHDEEPNVHHVCDHDAPSCFRRLLIQLANEDKQGDKK